jgi:hypothetical protein
MPHQKKKKADMSAFNPEAAFIVQAQNMERTITAEDRVAMQNARQRHLQGVGNHDPSLHVVVPDANNLPNARQGGFLDRLGTAVDAALAPDEAILPIRPEANRLLEAATLFLHNTTPSVAAPPVTQLTNPIDAIDIDELIVDVDTTTVADDTTAAIMPEARTRPQQRRRGRLSLDVRVARQQSNRKKAVVIDPRLHHELLNLNKAKENRRSERVLKTRMMEATRFIFYLHSHHPELVQSDLYALLIVASSAQYNTERAKELSLRKIIEETIKEFENTDNNKKVIKFNEVSPDIIGEYLCRRTGRQGSGLMRGKAYKNSRSHLAMFFKDQGFRWQEEFAEKVSDLVKGINRVVAKEVQKGHGNIEEGKREMLFEMYKLVNKWLIEMGGKDAIFA